MKEILKKEKRITIQSFLILIGILAVIPLIIGILIGYLTHSQPQQSLQSKAAGEQPQEDDQIPDQNSPQQQVVKHLHLWIGCSDGRACPVWAFEAGSGPSKVLGTYENFRQIRTIAGVPPEGEDLIKILQGFRDEGYTKVTIWVGTHDSYYFDNIDANCIGCTTLKKIMGERWESRQLVPKETLDWIDWHVAYSNPLEQAYADYGRLISTLVIDKNYREALGDMEIGVVGYVFNTSNQQVLPVIVNDIRRGRIISSAYTSKDGWEFIRKTLRLYVNKNIKVAAPINLDVLDEQMRLLIQKNMDGLPVVLNDYVTLEQFPYGEGLNVIVANGLSDFKVVESQFPGLWGRDRKFVVNVWPGNEGEAVAQLAYAWANAKKDSQLLFMFDDEVRAKAFIEKLAANDTFITWAKSSEATSNALLYLFGNKKTGYKGRVGGISLKGLYGPFNDAMNFVGLVLIPIQFGDRWLGQGETMPIPLKNHIGDGIAPKANSVPDEIRSFMSGRYIGPSMLDLRDEFQRRDKIYRDKTYKGQGNDLKGKCFLRTITDVFSLPSSDGSIRDADISTGIIVCSNLSDLQISSNGERELTGNFMVYYEPNSGQSVVWKWVQDAANGKPGGWQKTSGNTVNYTMSKYDKSGNLYIGRFELDWTDPNTNKSADYGAIISEQHKFLGFVNSGIEYEDRGQR